MCIGERVPMYAISFFFLGRLTRADEVVLVQSVGHLRKKVQSQLCLNRFVILL